MLKTTTKKIVNKIDYTLVISGVKRDGSHIRYTFKMYTPDSDPKIIKDQEKTLSKLRSKLKRLKLLSYQEDLIDG